ncbi:MAG: hypothetical protein GXO04_02480, partial [Aquificae bacterium]|nr:hypothetical protein [Aquificota bacterium]
LFNWLIILYSKLLGWDVITARAVSLTSTALCAVLLYLFSIKFLKDKKTALMGAVLFLTFADVLFWYGWLAEIDITLTLFVFLLFAQVFLLLRTKNPVFYYTSALSGGLIFMLKGFPAFAFWGLSLLALSVFERSPKPILNPHFFLSVPLLLLSSLWWVVFSQEPLFYLRRLWEESFSRVESSRDFGALILHLITYPLLNFKQLLPASLFALFLVGRFSLTRELRFFALLALLNYLPYWFSATSRGRYVLPLFTLVALILAKGFSEGLSERLRRYLFLSLVFVVFLRFLYGFIYLPYLDQKRGKPKAQALVAYELTKGARTACDCPDIKDFCLYVGFLRGEPLLRAYLTPGWVYLFDCKEREGLALVERFYVNKKVVYLYRKGVDVKVESGTSNF